MKKYRIEFNTTGFFSGSGIWECIDEFGEIAAENAQEAIEIAMTWYAENSSDYAIGEEEANSYAWRAAEIKFDEDGYPERYEWETK